MLLTIISYFCIAVAAIFVSQALRLRQLQIIRYRVFQLREQLSLLYIQGIFTREDFEQLGEVLNFLARNVRLSPLYLLMSIERAYYEDGLVTAVPPRKERRNKKARVRLQWRKEMNDLLLLIIETYSPFRLTAIAEPLSRIPGIGNTLARLACVPLSGWFLFQLLTRGKEPAVVGYMNHLSERAEALRRLKSNAEISNQRLRPCLA